MTTQTILIRKLIRASPGLQSRGERVFKPARTLGISIPGFSPGGCASNSIPREANDHANILICKYRAWNPSTYLAKMRAEGYGL